MKRHAEETFAEDLLLLVRVEGEIRAHSSFLILNALDTIFTHKRVWHETSLGGIKTDLAKTKPNRSVMRRHLNRGVSANDSFLITTALLISLPQNQTF